VVTKQPEDTKATRIRLGHDQAGRTFAQASVVTPPGETSELSWQYTVPKAMTRQADGSWLLTDEVVPQNTLNPFVLQITVVAPPGWTATAPDTAQPWLVNQGTAFLQVAVAEPMSLRLQVTRQ
jgi:hypothetical protein